MSISVEHLISKMEWAAAHEVSELAITIGGMRVKIIRGTPIEGKVPEPKTSLDKYQRTVGVEAQTFLAGIHDTITAPISGLCHLAPEAGGAPFVCDGQKVVEGQTICLIEAMKVMTSVSATSSGTVEAVLVTDGATVEVATPLLRLR